MPSTPTSVTCATRGHSYFGEPGDILERFPLGLNRDSKRGAKRRSLGGRFSFWDALRRRIGQFVRRLSAEVAPNSSLMQGMLQHDRNPLYPLFRPYLCEADHIEKTLFSVRPETLRVIWVSYRR